MRPSSAGLTSAVRLWSTLRLIDRLVRSSHTEWKRARGRAEERAAREDVRDGESSAYLLDADRNPRALTPLSPTAPKTQPSVLNETPNRDRSNMPRHRKPLRQIETDIDQR